MVICMSYVQHHFILLLRAPIVRRWDIGRIVSRLYHGTRASTGAEGCYVR